MPHALFIWQISNHSKNVKTILLWENELQERFYWWDKHAVIENGPNHHTAKYTLTNTIVMLYFIYLKGTF